MPLNLIVYLSARIRCQSRKWWQPCKSRSCFKIEIWFTTQWLQRLDLRMHFSFSVSSWVELRYFWSPERKDCLLYRDWQFVGPTFKSHFMGGKHQRCMQTLDSEPRLDCCQTEIRMCPRWRLNISLGRGSWTRKSQNTGIATLVDPPLQH